MNWGGPGAASCSIDRNVDVEECLLGSSANVSRNGARLSGLGSGDVLAAIVARVPFHLLVALQHHADRLARHGGEKFAVNRTLHQLTLDVVRLRFQLEQQEEEKKRRQRREKEREEESRWQMKEEVCERTSPAACILAAAATASVAAAAQTLFYFVVAVVSVRRRWMLTFLVVAATLPSGLLVTRAWRNRSMAATRS